TAHAEIIALRAAAQALRTYRLLDTTLYVTLEPCAMCAGAMVHARVKRLVYAAPDPRAGASGSIFDITHHPALNHRLDCTFGLRADECFSILSEFFVARCRTRSPVGLAEDLLRVNQYCIGMLRSELCVVAAGCVFATNAGAVRGQMLDQVVLDEQNF